MGRRRVGEGEGGGSKKVHIVNVCLGCEERGWEAILRDEGRHIKSIR